MQNTPNEQFLSIGDASEYLGVSIDTLRRWTRKGKIVTHRSPGGHRYFKKSELDQVFGTRYEREEKKDKPSDVSTQTSVSESQTADSRQPTNDVVREPLSDDRLPTPGFRPETYDVPSPISDNQIQEPSLHNIQEVDFTQPVGSVTPEPEPLQSPVEEKRPLEVPRYIKHQNISKYDLLLKSLPTTPNTLTTPTISGVVEAKIAEVPKPVTVENFDFHPILIPSTHRPPTPPVSREVTSEVEQKPEPKPVIHDVLEKDTKAVDGSKLEKILKNSFLVFLVLDAVLFFFWFINYRVNSPLP